jgi:hypothetical protein
MLLRPYIAILPWPAESRNADQGQYDPILEEVPRRSNGLAIFELAVPKAEREEREQAHKPKCKHDGQACAAGRKYVPQNKVGEEMDKVKKERHPAKDR